MNLKLNHKQKNILAFTALGAVFVILFILKTFTAALITACIAAFIFNPFYSYFYKKWHKKSLAASLTIIISFFVVFIPLCFVLWLSFNQVQLMIADLNELIQSGDVVIDSGALLDRLNETLSELTAGRVQLSAEQIQDNLLGFMKTITESISSILSSMVGSIATSVTSIIIFIYAYAGILTNSEKIEKLLKDLNPLGSDFTNLYLERAGIMTKSMVVVQMVVAIVQGIIGAVSLKLAGVDYFVFFAVVLSALSIIPLGGGVITIPLGIAMILFGNFWGGFIVLFTHFVITTNIDNILKGKMLSRDSKLHPALAMISILSGVAIFGFLGLIIGPVLMILAVTTIEVYLKVFSPELTKPDKV